MWANGRSDNGVRDRFYFEPVRIEDDNVASSQFMCVSKCLLVMGCDVPPNKLTQRTADYRTEMTQVWGKSFTVGWRDNWCTDESLIFGVFNQQKTSKMGHAVVCWWTKDNKHMKYDPDTNKSIQVASRTKERMTLLVGVYVPGTQLECHESETVTTLDVAKRAM